MNDFKFDPKSLVENPWITYDEANWSFLTASQTPKKYNKNDQIYMQGDYLEQVYIVKTGRIRLGYFSENGQEKGIFIAEKGCLFGEAAALPTYPTYYTATAIVDSELYVITREKVEESIRNNPDFAMDLIYLMARKMRIYSAQEVDLSFTEIYDRVCCALIHLVDIYGVKTKLGYKITIKFTHQELANMIHASRVSVANIFSMFTKQEVLMKSNGYFIITNLEVLYHSVGKKF